MSCDSSSIVTALNTKSNYRSLRTSVQSERIDSIEEISTQRLSNSKTRTEDISDETCYEQLTNNERNKKINKKTSAISKNGLSGPFEPHRSFTSTKKSSEYSFDDTFETLSSDYNSNESLNNLNPRLLEEVKRNDYIQFIRLKLKLEQHDKKYGKQHDEANRFHLDQIENCILRAINSSKKAESTSISSAASASALNIKSEVINRVRTENIIKKINDVQCKKIAALGEDIKSLFPYKEESIEALAEKIYYKKKCDHIHSELVKNKFSEHTKFYTDSILLIGHLAATMPKHTDNTKYVFEQLLKPLEKKNPEITTRFF